MSSFPASADRVRDAGLASRDRLLALRECVLCFQPYGFRATWHHLIVSADVPRNLDDDPRSLTRAVDELEEARLVWRAQSEDYEARRRREKAAGRRDASRADNWRTWAGLVAYCPDLEKHPTERLVVVVRRVIAAYESGVDPLKTCRACGTQVTADTPCPDCGVDPAGPTANRPEIRVRTSFRWRAVWRRTAR
ncbi:hypothetical protein SAMN05421837_11429 [Amycolatopsis pretoriensis]|uniref:Uncharacterized protein n=1 Tax=Amycolatopsis pretoriensis TaxID=218821 RepID=A0A1H5RGS3_9PSEU|nr:hypothetical protein [Amycolatopsis pretoriensis]SEF37469.1 hypothetical protein SAMN05421837_11429 [Amycolatopsis pretoriensis]